MYKREIRREYDLLKGKIDVIVVYKTLFRGWLQLALLNNLR